MTSITDENGRWELGFPKRAWPAKEPLRPEMSLPSPNRYGPRFVTDDEVEMIRKLYDGLFPIYRSVYRSRRYEFNENSSYGKPEKESAVVDTLFLEIECQPCGFLCDSVAKEALKLLNFLEDAGVVPRFNLSGSKSIHVYMDFDEVNIPFKHETVKRVTRFITKKSGCRLIDKAAQHGVTQLARLLNAQNPKTKHYAVPITRKEIMSLSADQLVNLGKQPRNIEIPKESNDVLAKLLITASKDVAEKKGTPELSQIDIDVEGCKEIEILIQKGAGSGGRHYSRVALIRWLMSKGKSRYEIETALKQFNAKCKPPDTWDSVQNDISFNVSSDQKIPHCYFIFEATGVNCETCPWKRNR